MEDENTAPFWFKHFKKGKMAKLQAKIAQMHPVDIKKRFKKSLNDGLLYGISKEYERALAIYLLSDDSLKEELDGMSMELQSKKIDINETIIDAFAMANPSSGLPAQHMKDSLREYQEKQARKKNEEKKIEPQE